MSYRDLLPFLMISMFAIIHAHDTVGQGSIRDSAEASSEITFSGTANGGVLSVASPNVFNNIVTSIQTSKGESAESVVARLAEALNENPQFTSSNGHVKYHDQSLIAYCQFCVGGTETGLGIPPPPKSLSVRYDYSSGQYIVEWEADEEVFDKVYASIGNAGLGLGVKGATQKIVGYPPGFAKESIDRGGLVFVIGQKGGLYSAVGGVVYGCSQEECVTLPYSGGVHPNWSSWSESKETDGMQFSFEEKADIKSMDYRFPYYAMRPPENLTFQRIGTSSAASSGGILRRFLGLVPGSTYRIRVRVNTLQMTPAQGGWSFEVLAAYNRPGREPLTPGQLSGVEPLPNGGKGKDAGLLARFGPDRTTSGEWFEIDTSKSPDTSKQGDITLPPDVDTITLWIRYQAEGPTTGVGMDWVALEDLTCTK